MVSLRWLAPTTFTLGAVLLAGCSDASNGNLATVTGKVTHNGAPVAGAKVNFYSTVESSGKAGGSYSATTDSSGKYAILMVNNEPGIPPGMYKVTIIKLDLKGNLPPDFDQGQLEASGMAKNILPKDYESVNTTNLSATLNAGKNENVDFDLKGAASKSVIGTP
jgi:hypothetical protein